MAKKAETELNESNKREAAIASENSVQQVRKPSMHGARFKQCTELGCALHMKHTNRCLTSFMWPLARGGTSGSASLRAFSEPSATKN